MSITLFKLDQICFKSENSFVIILQAKNVSVINRYKELIHSLTNQFRGEGESVGGEREKV